MKRLLILLIVLAALVPTAVFAQDSTAQTRGVLFRIGGDLTITASEAVDAVVVIGGNVRVEGTVRNLLWVINGDATITGTAGGDVLVMNGSLDLTPSATVKNVSLMHSDLKREPGATLTGSLSIRHSVPRVGWGLWFVVWLGITLLVLAAGLLFAAGGGRQLTEMAEQIRRRTAESVLAAVLLWIAVPVVAVLLLLTVVGIPLSIGVLLFLLPALWFAGYLVSGTALGLWLAHLSHSASEPEHPYIAAIVGLTLLQAVGLVPVIGFFVVLVAGLFGGGVLIYRFWRVWHGQTPAVPRAIIPA